MQTKMPAKFHNKVVRTESNLRIGNDFSNYFAENYWIVIHDNWDLENI